MKLSSNLIRYILIFVTSISSLSVNSKLISEQEAYKIAQNKLLGKKIQNFSSKSDKVSKIAAGKRIYIFNAENDNGFVIVSGDDRTRAVLGYSDYGHINYEDAPSNVKWLLDSYENFISSLNENANLSHSKKTTKTVKSERENIPILINTQWGQNAPFNNKCPEAYGVRCVTGCVATAMAQVINYHKWPQDQTNKIDGYTTYTNKIVMEDLPSKNFNWEDMSDSEIADLMLYCGQSVKMNYGPFESGSSGSKVPTVLSDIFHFGKSSLYEKRTDYTDDDWIDLIYDQLQKKLPILAYGDGSQNGHAFIIDGYEEELFHVNWGWNGAYDGYFSMEELKPTANDNYSANLEIISNVYPPVDVLDSDLSKIVVQNISTDKSIIERTSKYLTFSKFSVSALLASDLRIDKEIQIGFALTNDDGIVKILAEDSFEFWTTDNEIKMDENINLTPEISNGQYRLVAVHRVDNSEEWKLDSRSHARYIDVEITDTSLKLTPVNKGKNGVEQLNFGINTINGVRYRLVSEYDSYRAYILPLANNMKYSGEIIIPDWVEYNTLRFKVFGEENDPFASADEVTSISTPITLTVNNCANLETLEFREGVLKATSLNNCPKLRSINYATSCRKIGTIKECASLTELIFHNHYTTTLLSDNDQEIWSEESLPSLENIYFYGEEPPTFLTEKGINNSRIKMHIPEGMIDTYQACGYQNLNLIDDLEKIGEYVKWDYCGIDEDANDGLIATSGNNDVEVAMQIPSAESKNYVGNKIVAIEYFTTEESLKDDSNRNPEYVFLTEGNKDYVRKQASSAVRGAWTRVELEEPYEISNEDVFIGIGKHGRLTFNWANLKTYGGGFWYRTMGSDYSEGPTGVWEHNCGEEDWNYPVAIRAIIQGDNLPNDMAIVDAQYDKCDNLHLSKDGNIKLKIRNRSPKLAKEITINLSYDKKNDQIMNTNVLIPSGHDQIINIKSNGANFNTHVIDLNISEIDGQLDGIESNSTVSFKLLSTDLDYYPRKTVLEEMTDTKDGNCSRFIALKDYMKKTCPDDFIAISIHSDSEMTVNDNSYDSFLEKVPSNYYLNINRTEWNMGLPFTTKIKDLKDAGEALIKSDAVFTKDGRIQIDTQTAFNGKQKETDNFTIAYVLVEDHVGPFIQNNNYSKPSEPENPNDYMNWWVHQGTSVEYEFDDVARTINIYDGIENLFPQDIIKDEVYDSNFCIKIPGYVQNPENLKVITLLINKNTEEIVNADSSIIEGETPDLSIEIGDSNGNGEINIADAVNTANFVVGKNVEKIHFNAADVNNDSHLSFADASGTISIILEQPSYMLSENMRTRRTLQSIKDVVYLITDTSYEGGKNSIKLFLENSEEYVALQADIKLTDLAIVDSIKIGKQLEKTHKVTSKQIDKNTIRFIVYDFNNHTFVPSNDAIVEIYLNHLPNPVEMDIINIIASDAEAHDFSLSIDSASSCCLIFEEQKNKKIEITSTTDHIEVRNAKSKKILISSLDGCIIQTYIADSDLEIINLPKGLYIIKVDNVTEKILVK